VAAPRWTLRAERDLENILEGLSDISPSFAAVTAARIFQALEQVQSFPYSGRAVPEYDSPDVREMLVAGYRIVYVIVQETSLVAAIVTSRQRLRRVIDEPLADMDLP
jgi:toxin ParE1/3/4